MHHYRLWNYRLNINRTDSYTDDSDIQYVYDIMSLVSRQQNLIMGTDVVEITRGSYAKYLSYFSTHPNSTKFGVLFCLGSLHFANITVPCYFSDLDKDLNVYSIFYNNSMAPNGFLQYSNLVNRTYPELLSVQSII